MSRASVVLLRRWGIIVLLGLLPLLARPLGDTVRAEPGGWEFTGGPPVGVDDLVVDPRDPSIIYAATWRGVYRSTNQGASWDKILSGNMVVALALDPKTAGILYAATGNNDAENGIYKSTDGGDTWSLLNRGLPDAPRWTPESPVRKAPIISIAVDPQRPSILYVGTGYGDANLYKSTDGGLSWQPLSLAAGAATTLVVVPQHPDTLYASTTSGTYKSTDGGASWQTIPLGVVSYSRSAIVVAPDAPATLYAIRQADTTIVKSTDGGESWTPADNGLPVNEYGTRDVVALAADPTRPDTLYAAIGNRLYKTPDGGAHWYAVDNDVGYNVVRSVALDLQQPGVIYAGSQEYGVWKHTGPERLTERSGVFSLSEVWQPSAPQPYNYRVDSMVVSPESLPTIYALTERALPEGIRLWGLYKSTDNGDSWTAVNMQGLEGTTILHNLTMDYRHPDTLYIIGGSRYLQYLFKSVGGGDWVRIGEPITFTALAMDFRDSQVLYAGKQAGPPVQPEGSIPSAGLQFLRSTDGGQTWERFQTMDRPYVGMGTRWVAKILVDANNPDVLYAVEGTTGSKGLFDMTLLRGDREGNWQEMPQPVAPQGPYWGAIVEPWGLAFDPQDNALYVGSYRRYTGSIPSPEEMRLWRSTNSATPEVAAVAWTEVYRWDLGPWFGGGVMPTVEPLAVNARQPKALFVQTRGADAALRRSGDGGQTWSTLRIPVAIYGAPGTDPNYSWTSAETGYTVSGQWLRFLREHGDIDNMGYPRTEVIADPAAGWQTVQYFQRVILEWHPENPPQYRIQRRLLGDILYPGADPPHSPKGPPPGPYHYFPFSQDKPTGPPGRTGLGHFVADYTRTGQAIYFKEYFDSHGGVDAFGYPKEEPKLRNGLWTQRFQAAVFEYHPENDRDGLIPGTRLPYRNFRVQLELLSDKYIQQYKLPYQ